MNKYPSTSKTIIGNLALAAMLGVFQPADAQRAVYATVDSLNAKQLNWQHLDIKAQKTAGISTDRAYRELLTNQSPKKNIVVAVIDAGVDIEHEDLNGKIWTNAGEVPGNGIDDDHNGYVDDMHGWNFLGNSKGENINYETLEYTRLLRRLKPLFEKTDSAYIAPDSLKNDYELYKLCSEMYSKELKKYESRKENLKAFEDRLETAQADLRTFLDTDVLTVEKVKAIKTKDKYIRNQKELYLKVVSNVQLQAAIKQMKEKIDESLDYNLNLDYNPRTLIGDNTEDLSDTRYGNNNVEGPDAFHGTFVAGIIGANRNNNMGIDGIAEGVQIMSVRAVPNGDERDKDVALAIRYAVDNGAQIINMSFGKGFSPQKEMVDQAFRYAEEKGVLLVHAAGNESLNVDVTPCFPAKTLNNLRPVSTWLNVGASTPKIGKALPAGFSNYGQTQVDLFAPGTDVVSLTTGSRYLMADGTSFACPMVAGAAALVWSYYPQLTALEIKEILLKSATPLQNVKVEVPSEERSAKKRTKAAFGTLSQTGGVLNAYRALKLAAEY